MRGQGTISGEGRATGLVTLAEGPSGVPPMACGLVAGLEAAALVRSHAREHFRGRLSAGVIGDLELVLTELVANAAAASRPGDPVAVDVRMSTDELLIEVTDQSKDTPRQRLIEDLDEDGRGLLLVGSLTRCWGWQMLAHGKVVWGALPIRPADASNAQLTQHHVSFRP